MHAVLDRQAAIGASELLDRFDELEELEEFEELETFWFVAPLRFSAALSGSDTRNVEPWPGPALCASIRPPWS